MHDFFGHKFPSRFVINLDKRKDRLDYITYIFEQYSINNVTKFPGVDGDHIQDTSKYNGLRKGEIGCLLAHTNVFRYCIENNIPEAVIFEDDVSFLCTTDYSFEKDLNKIPDDWKMIMLGGNHKFGPPSSYKQIKDNIWKTTHSYSLQSYIIKLEFMKEIINYIDSLNIIDKPVDVLVAEKMNQFSTYFLSPVLTTQITGYSDIQQREYNCDYFLLHGI